MARRTNHPLKTLFLLLVTAGVAWASWEYVHVRGVFKMEPEVFVAREILDNVRDMVLERYEDDVCFLELGPVHYRPKESHYRVEFTVADGCLDSARGMCEDIAGLVHDEVNDSVGVFAFNAAGNPVARFVE